MMSIMCKHSIWPFSCTLWIDKFHTIVEDLLRFSFTGCTDICDPKICCYRMSIIHKNIIWPIGYITRNEQLYKNNWHSVDPQMYWLHWYACNKDLLLDDVNYSWKYDLSIQLYDTDWAASHKSLTPQWISISVVTQISSYCRITMICWFSMVGIYQCII
jgi:hypothetical protein